MRYFAWKLELVSNVLWMIVDMKIVYIFARCTYNKYYASNFTKSLLSLTNYYHYFHHLNIQKCCQHHPSIQVSYLLNFYDIKRNELQKLTLVLFVFLI